ncbi:hypothetical protein CsSME_00005782 [Camellia sinensis var. sinensis]
MKGLRNSIAYCVKENKQCVGWVEKYFKDCLCNFNDELSFAFGLISLVCWGVAEIPQIITNFRTKSSHGVSLLFLLTWIAGDVFNLVGCLLEPATLPTQFYTALLYTASTVVLVLQSLYYDHLYSWSARSLAWTNTLPTRSPLRAARSGPPSVTGLEHDSSSDDEPIRASSHKSRSKPKPIPRSAGSAAFLAASISLPSGSKALMHVYMGLSGRRLLQEQNSTENNVIGQCLGWMMAAIYMGGRIPQICLNIKRGSVEGLNPLMFIFALIANATYVGSIVVRTSEWDKIKPNLPWLLDAVVCVALDLLIILQYIYYRYIRERMTSESKDYGDYYVEANKAPLS